MAVNYSRIATCIFLVAFDVFLMVDGAVEADSWRDGELFLATGTLAFGAAAIACSIGGLVTAMAEQVTKRRAGSAPVLDVVASVTMLAAIVLTCGWFLLVLQSGSSD